MKQISFICCYTNSKLVDELKKSVECFQSYLIEWVMIDNSHGKYSSAASALNAGAHACSTDIFVFLHQDIEFDSEKSLDLICQEVQKGKIVGVAGRKINGGALVTNIDDGLNRERHHSYCFESTYENVLTCDECLFAMRREVFDEVKGFDETTFDGWHFYGVDLCLRAYKKGIQSCVIPSKLWHKSKGSHDKNWKRYEEKLRRIYRKDFRVIYYPCGRCYTNPVLFHCARLLRPIRKILLPVED